MDIEARRAVESLRSGVPSPSAVKMLGTTQQKITRRFTESLDFMESGVGSAPIALTANFGDGKSHLIQCLRADAEQRGFATSVVTVSPEMPIGNAHTVLKAIAEEAIAPNHNGKAVMELAAKANSNAIPTLRLWAREAPIADRFRALLRVYEATKDEELRMEILGDIEGRPVSLTRLRQELKELQEASDYDLKGPRNAFLAHDRLRILGKFCQTHGAKGLIVFFDEVERIAQFSFKARLSAYQELGWWASVCQEEDSCLYAVFTLTAGAIYQCLEEKGDEDKVRSETTLLHLDEREMLASDGIHLLKRADDTRLESATSDQFEQLQHGVRGLYASAYGVAPALLPVHSEQKTIRSEIRRWITVWDLQRHYPDYMSTVTAQAVTLDSEPIDDENLDLGEE